jgi:uncharacterized membrane protein
VLAPLGGISLLWNSLLAHVILGEGFTHAMMLGTVFIATGAVLIAIFGVVPDGNHTLDELLALWARGPFLVFFTVVCVLVVATLGVAHLFVWRMKSTDRIMIPDDETPSNYASPRSIPAIPFRPTAADGSTNEHNGGDISPLSTIHPIDAKTVRFVGVDDDRISSPLARFNHRQRILTLCGLAFAAASGTLSGLCLVLAKAAVELVIATIDHWRTGKGTNEFARMETWLLVAGLAVAAILQLVYLNYSLAFASPALICPLAFCFFNLASIFDGLIFYDQFGRLSPHQILLVSVGVAVLLVGVWVVSAIQPTGDGGLEGGIEVGTWVEDEVRVEDGHEAHDELEAGEGATLLGGDEVAEPAHVEVTSPESPLFMDSANGPLSPNATSPSSPMRRRRPRYGTLIPDLVSRHVGPTGFAFGIGAASPGFALRSTSITRERDMVTRRNTFSHGRSNSLSAFPPPRRRSEDDMNAAIAPSGESAPRGHGPGRERRRPRPISLPAAGSLPPPAISSAPPRDVHVEDALAAWEHERSTRRLRPAPEPEAAPGRWFSRLWGRDRGVKLT